MSERGQNKKGPGRGFLRHGYYQHVGRFDPEQFERVRAKAVRDGTSISDTLRTLVEWGLMAEEQENGQS